MPSVDIGSATTACTGGTVRATTTTLVIRVADPCPWCGTPLVDKDHERLVHHRKPPRVFVQFVHGVAWDGLPEDYEVAEREAVDLWNQCLDEIGDPDG